MLITFFEPDCVGKRSIKDNVFGQDSIGSCVRLGVGKKSGGADEAANALTITSIERFRIYLHWMFLINIRYEIAVTPGSWIAMLLWYG
jgi:hypothetical protein